MLDGSYGTGGVTFGPMPTGKTEACVQPPFLAKRMIDVTRAPIRIEHRPLRDQRQNKQGLIAP